MSRATLLVVVAAFLVAGCSSGRDDPGPPEAAVPDPETVLVIGSGSSEGSELRDPLREAWPRLVFAESLTRPATLVSGASGPATVSDALAFQLPLAREVEPDWVLVMLGSYDLNRETPPEVFGSQLRELLAALDAAAGGRVLVADLPALPAYGDAARRAYNDEIAAAVSEAGATLVSLANETLEPVDDEHDYQPNAAGHRVIADAFGAVIHELGT
ncbi:MAG: SGNH/GDSL hydrolase family protein [Actinomycetota bacterium]|nr:SGNH/GDSL hydrolase family protein [Actinomycetota bacterium]